MQDFRRYLDSIADDLAAAVRTDAKSRRRTIATLHHCVQFSTWASLAGQGLSDEEAAEIASG